MKIIKGISAAKGKAKGFVRKVLKVADFKNLQTGEILVTNLKPENITVVKRAKAIITDAGGITSHIAKAARELKTPCIVNAKDATKILKNGDLVEVDASKGVVRLRRKAMADK